MHALRLRARLVLVLALATVAVDGVAATVTRTFALRKGWNAIHLDVRPADTTIEQVLGTLPVESVWRHQTRLTSVDFVKDPSEAVWNRDQWLVHVPTNRIESLDNNLFQMYGGYSYLIRLSNAATWSVTGTPVIRAPDWKADAFNRRGSPIDAPSPPTFRDFFKFSPAHVDPNTQALRPI